MADLGCTVHGYDPFDLDTLFNQQYNQKNGTFHFHKLAITDQDDEFNKEDPSLTFESILKRNGDENKTITYVKFDIEHWERKVFPNIFKSDILDRVEQIGIEMHTDSSKKITQAGMMEIMSINLDIYDKLFNIFNFRY